MKLFVKIFNAITIISLLLAVVGIIVYYVIEFISSFLVSTINLVEIGNIIWTIIYLCFGSAVCSLVLAYYNTRKYD